MERLVTNASLCVIATLLIIAVAPQISAQQGGSRRVPTAITAASASARQQPTERVRAKEERVRAGRLSSGESVRLVPGDAIKLKRVRRNLSVKITKGDRPAGRQPASPRLEYTGGLERAREAVSAREAFGGKH